MTKKGSTLTFFANLDVFVLKQVCQEGKKEREKNTGTFIRASAFLLELILSLCFRNTEMWDIWALFQA